MVAGIRTPEDLDTMRRLMPEAYAELVENCNILERHYKDMMVSTYIQYFCSTHQEFFKFEQGPKFGCIAGYRIHSTRREIVDASM